MSKLLILGGTTEARTLASLIHAAHPTLDMTTSLAGVTAKPGNIAGKVRVGGFGGAKGLAAFVKDQGINWVVDATHPFAARITENAVKACTDSGTAYLRLDRPQWEIPSDTDVIFVPDAIEAAGLIARTSSAALLTIGNKELAAFEGVENVKLVVRMIEQPSADLTLNNATYVIARPPFALDDEVALMREHAIDTVVTKASGGDATRAKIDAAALIGARIIILRRPPAPDTERVLSAEDAMAWIAKKI